MNIKFRILEVHPAQRTAVVEFYTDEIADAYPDFLDEKIAQEMASGRFGDNLQACQVWCRRNWVCGFPSSVSLPDPLPSSQAELRAEILKAAPWAALRRESKNLTDGLPDLSSLDSLIGQEQEGEVVTPEEAPVEETVPGEIPIVEVLRA